MECDICCETVDKVFSCGNVKCTQHACINCILEWIKSNKKDSSNKCVMCNHEIDYCVLHSMLKETNKLDEFINIKKHQLFELELRNNKNIENKELFNEFIKCKKQELKDICMVKTPTVLTIPYFNTKFNKRTKTSNIKKYKSYIELKNYYEEQTKPIIDMINKSDSNEQIIKYKRKLVAVAHKILMNAELDESKLPLFACPIKDCTGHVLDNDFRCDMCNSLICPGCRNYIYKHEQCYRDDEDDTCCITVDEEEIVDELNKLRIENSLKPYDTSKTLMVKCNKEEYDTCQLLTKNSKQCPNCHEYIQKSIGCDQMYCTSCHTCFDWNTLKIINSSYVHNPYLIEEGGQYAFSFSDIKCDILDNSFYEYAENHKDVNNVVFTVYAFKLFNHLKYYLDTHNIMDIEQENIISINKYKMLIANCLVSNKSKEEMNKYDTILMNELYETYHKTQSLIIIEEMYQTLAQIINFYLIPVNMLLKSKSYDPRNELFDTLCFEIYEGIKMMNDTINEKINIINYHDTSLINIRNYIVLN